MKKTLNREANRPTFQFIHAAITALTMICICILCSCSANAKKTIDTTTTDPLTQNTLESAANHQSTISTLYWNCTTHPPEDLATIMSAFPRQLQKINIDSNDPTDLLNLLKSENGDQIQSSMLNLLKEILEDPNTKFIEDYSSFKSYARYEVNMLQLGRINPDIPMSTDNCCFYWCTESMPMTVFVIATTEDESEQNDFAYFGISYEVFHRFIPITS